MNILKIIGIVALVEVVLFIVYWAGFRLGYQSGVEEKDNGL